MSREAQVRFCEGLGGKLPGATQHVVHDLQIGSECPDKVEKTERIQPTIAMT